MNHTASFSGGRTSATMKQLLIAHKVLGLIDDIEYIFMDTGAEHPKTYDFIRACVKYFGIKLTVLQGDFNQPIGTGHSYKVVSVDDLKYDMLNGPFMSMMTKYGVPTVASAWCTSRMKEEVYQKYCDDKYGKGNYTTWLGIRADEVPRLVGNAARRDQSTYLNLRDDGYDDDDQLELFLAIKSGEKTISDYPMSERSEKLLNKRMRKISAQNLNFLAEITDYDKQDILSIWRNMPFDLQIDEHLGNCVFCIKKSINKIALAARDEPQLLAEWQTAILMANDRLNTGDIPKGVMYRGSNSMGSIIAKFALHSRDEIAGTIRSMKQYDTNSCSESCEAFAADD